MTLELDRHGVAREQSLPMGKDQFVSDIVSRYRVKQWVLHNPEFYGWLLELDPSDWLRGKN
jgi:hypothetical protein